MQLKAGLRLQSTACATQAIVVKGAGEVDVRCGGHPMVAVAPGVEATNTVHDAHAAGTLMGKRYADEDGTIELLCTKPGAGSLSIGDTVLAEKGAKALPSSD